jgi:formylglycine-generating enzyme required for sulfatase activity
LIAAGAIIVAACLLYVSLGEDGEYDHYDRAETQLVVVNTTGAPLELFEAGADLSAKRRVDDFDGKSIWLARGDYFIHAADQNGELLYPVNIIGYRAGPESDGSLAVTIRHRPEVVPPVAKDGRTDFKYIPPGYFLMGDRLNPGEPHYVWTQGFFMGEFELTNAEFRAFMNSPDGYGDDSNWTAAGLRWRKRSKTQTSAAYTAHDKEFNRFGQNDMPVTQVTWFEAAAYCQWITNKYGQGNWQFSLPTESEWEKAARGPDGFDYPLGDRLSDRESKLYNWKKNPLADRTVFGAVESSTMYSTNRWGLYHMGGNVAEWTQSAYQTLNRQHPYDEDGRNRDDQEGGRVVRGGSWYSATNALLYIAYRDAFEPEISHHDLGFRIVARLLS